MGKRWKRLWRDRSGEGYVDMVVLVCAGCWCWRCVCRYSPVFVKNSSWMCLLQSWCGKRKYQVGWGAETDRREESLIEKNRSGTGYLMVAGGADTAK